MMETYLSKSMTMCVAGIADILSALNLYLGIRMYMGGLRTLTKTKHRASSNLEIIKRIRNDWGNVKPYTRPHKDKKKYDRKKQQNIED